MKITPYFAGFIELYVDHNIPWLIYSLVFCSVCLYLYVPILHTVFIANIFLGTHFKVTPKFENLPSHVADLLVTGISINSAYTSRVMVNIFKKLTFTEF